MLNVLHTADWHLGHSLHGISRIYEHQCFLTWLLQQIEHTEADVLIIAGDVFDSANPPASAQSMFYDFLVQARQCSERLEIVIVGGNHDSAARLDAPSQILQSLGIHVVGGLSRLENGEIDWQRLIFPLHDKWGTINAICGAMPFIRHADLPQENSEIDDDPLIAGVAQLYQQLYGQMQEYRKQQILDESIGQILTGHCYMVGTELSELSERRILGGNQHALPATIFNDRIDYVALGHLHKAQVVNYKQHIPIHYSGSPIPLSFSERNYKHQILLLHLDKNENTAKRVAVEKIIIPRAVVMQVLPARAYTKLEKLAELIREQKYANKLTLDTNTHILLEIRIELDKPESGLRQQVEQLLEDKAVRLLKISTHYSGHSHSLAESLPEKELEALKPEEVFQQCYQRTYQSCNKNADSHKNESTEMDKLSILFRELLESVEGQR